MDNYVSLEEMLASRERRVWRQEKLIKKFNHTLICLTMNIPGPIKNSREINKSFHEGLRRIRQQLDWNYISILKESIHEAKTGNEGFLVVKEEPLKVKKLMAIIEDGFPMGRIFDIDIIKTNGEKVSRQDVGMPVRRCLICRQEAGICARSRAHTVEELFRKANELIQSHFDQEFANELAHCTCRALLYEVSVTPKPGLVDRANSGSHSDMDIFTFLDSSSVLVPFFRDFVLIGIENQTEEPDVMFARIRYHGRQAEEAMFTATNRINTHKGLIFSLGILCGAAGYLYGRGEDVTTERLLALVKEMMAGIDKDFEGITLENARSYGEILYAKYGIKGIRGEAASGFQSVVEYGLPRLKAELKKGKSYNDAGAIVLMNLLANVVDTNVITRSNKRRQEELARHAARLLAEEEVSFDMLNNFDKWFICQNISPGGCADLLAITFFLYFLENESEIETKSKRWRH